MGGIRLGGRVIIVNCSPPVGAYGAGGSPTTDPQVWRSCSDNAPGVMNAYTDFSGFTDIDQVSNPVLSPDGTKILFEGNSVSTGYRNIWVTDNIINSTPTLLVDDPSNYRMHHAWHPDSDQFIYVAPTGGTFNNALILVDSVTSPGSPTTVHTPPATWTCYRPHFNFDGSRIAYFQEKNSGAGAGCDIRVMDDDGSNDAALDTGLTGYRFNQPPAHSWAQGSNQLVYDTGGSGNNIFVIQDDGSGKTNVIANGPAAGGSGRLSEFAWPPDDSYVVYTANLGNGFMDIIRAELDGSTTTRLNTSHGAINQTWFQAAIIYNNRIWFIEATDGSSSQGWLSSVALGGTDYVKNFDSTAGTGDTVYPFTGGDGFYYN